MKTKSMRDYAKTRLDDDDMADLDSITLDDELIVKQNPRCSCIRCLKARLAASLE